MKKLLEYLPFHFLCFLIFGILLQFYCEVWSFSTLYLLAFLIGLLILLFVFKKVKGFEVITFLFFLFLGIAIVFFNDDRNYTNYYQLLAKPNSFKTLEISKILKPGKFYSKYEAKVILVDSINSTGYTLINIKKDTLHKTLEIGQHVYTKEDFKELIPPLNPHQFDYKNYLAKQGIYSQLFLNHQQYKLRDHFEFSLKRIAFVTRNLIQKSLMKYDISVNEYAVMNALLLGQRQKINKDLMDNYAKAGAIHILAVSGLHVGILLLILNYLLYPLQHFKNGNVVKVVLIVVLLWCFAFIAGLSASVVRAVTMFSAVAVTQIFKRKQSVEYSLVISMFLLLLVKPLFLFDVGFQLSYLAVFGIIWVQPKLYNMWNPKWKFIDFYWKLITVSIAAQFGILPLSLFYFHQFPGLFILSNLVIIPFLGLILGFGILLILLSILNILPEFYVHTYEKIIFWMNTFVSWIAKQESALFTHISFSQWLLIVSYFVIISGCLFFIKRKPRRLIYFLVSIVLAQTVLWTEKWNRNTKHEFIIFHKSRFSIFGNRYGDRLSIYHDLNPNLIFNENSILSYSIGENVNIKSNTEILNYFQVGQSPILILNKKGTYDLNFIKSPIVVLTESPKINLERMILKIKPSIIVANGSNYKSQIEKWEETCIKTKTPFWYTGQKGAYIVKQ